MLSLSSPSSQTRILNIEAIRDWTCAPEYFTKEVHIAHSALLESGSRYSVLATTIIQILASFLLPEVAIDLAPSARVN